MKINTSSFLLLGKGKTYQHCRNFFIENSIAYDAINTDDVLKINNKALITNDKRIDLDKIDYIVISPGISPDNHIVEVCRSMSIKIITDIDILQSISDVKCICITGTNGKTSTVELLASILNDNGVKSIACGNNGVSVFDSLKGNYKYLIIELSSYQLQYISNLKSYISVILNLSHDHIERHGKISNYFQTKKKIFLNSQYSIISSDINEKIDDVIKYGIDNSVIHIDGLDDNLEFINNKIIFGKYAYNTRGRHDALNLCACLAVCNIINIPIMNVLNSFKQRTPLKHRQEFLLEKSGIKFINDSKSTNVNSTLAALDAYEHNIILLMGGAKKNMPYENLEKTLNKKVKKLILFGDNSNYIFTKIQNYLNKIKLNNMNEALDYAISIADKGDVILLSPGSPSFDTYENFEKRGDHFRSLVESYANK